MIDMRNLKAVKNIYLVMIICCILGGLVLLIWPGIGLDVLCKACGIFFLLYGLAKLSGYFTKDLFQLAFQFDFGLGIVSIIMGALMLFRTEHLVEFLVEPVMGSRSFNLAHLNRGNYLVRIESNSQMRTAKIAVE